jgi:hypothetical protein
VNNFRLKGFKQEALHKLINSVWNKEELPDQWKESIIVPVHKKGDKPDRNNYPGISLQFLVVRVSGYRSKGPGPISGATRFSEK